MSRKARALPSSSDASSVRKRRTAPDAAARWRALFGCEPPHASGFIDQAIAWREQVLAHGDVSPAIAHDLAIAARQARGGAEAASEAPCLTPALVPAASEAKRLTPTRAAATPRSCPRSKLEPLPPASSQLVPGARLVKAYGGRNHVVEVTGDGFLYEGQRFASLSAVAKYITGTHWNGLLFFGLRRRKTYPAKAAAHG